MLTLILGGARSGKSGYAQSLYRGTKDVIYIATAGGDLDEEMRGRVERHRAARPTSWRTVEEPLLVPKLVRRSLPSDVPVIVDCITLWISNLYWEYRGYEHEARERVVLERVEELLRAAGERDVTAVSNEVGSGIVPESPVGRSFRDLQGRVNQRLARGASRVFFLVAGLPLTLKNSS